MEAESQKDESQLTWWSPATIFMGVSDAVSQRKVDETMSECIRLSVEEERDWNTGSRNVIRQNMQAYADEHDVDVEMNAEDGIVLHVFTPWDGR